MGIYSQAAGGGFEFGNCLNGDGVNDFVSLNTPITIATTSTVSLWLNLNDSDFDGTFIGNNADGSVAYRLLSATQIRIYAISASDYIVPNMTTGVWYNIVIANTASGSRLYLNGVESSSGLLGNRAATFNQLFKYHNTAPSFVLNAKYDEFGLLNGTSPTAQNITDLYNGGSGNDFTDVMGSSTLHYHFNETGTATTAVDSSGSGNNGTLNNFPTSGMWVAHPQPLLLDTYSGAAVAYSLRRLTNNYTGNFIKVRRSSDNAELDIGYNSLNQLDTVALLAHVGTGGSDNGFITTYYDQSGNANNKSQTSASLQSKIVDSGAVILVNSKVSDLFDSADFYNLDSAITPVTTFNVSKMDVSGTVNYLLWSTANTKGYFLYGGAIGNNVGVFDGAVKSAFSNDLNQHINYFNYNGTNFDISQDGGSDNALTAGVNFAVDKVGRDTANFSINGKNQELIIYATDKSSDKAGILANINQFYSIF